VKLKIARITVSDRASAGVYEDRSGPEIDRIVRRWFGRGPVLVTMIVPDDRRRLSAALRRLADRERCDLILTTGGTGPAPRDVTPEATRVVLDRELPGFGELMRWRSYAKVPTAILSRATAGIRGRSLIVNLPGKPRAVVECLRWIKPAIIETLQMLRGIDPHGA
jgi:molybdopterin adenylyltransferase